MELALWHCLNDATITPIRENTPASSDDGLVPLVELVLEVDIPWLVARLGHDGEMVHLRLRGVSTFAIRDLDSGADIDVQDCGRIDLDLVDSRLEAGHIRLFCETQDASSPCAHYYVLRLGYDDEVVTVSGGGELVLGDVKRAALVYWSSL